MPKKKTALTKAGEKLEATHRAIVRVSKNGNRLGRGSLYDKPFRTTIMRSKEARDIYLPELQNMIGCSGADIYEKALRDLWTAQRAIHAAILRKSQGGHDAND